jgi:GNAT superfamily N-acetyltransferase
MGDARPARQEDRAAVTAAVAAAFAHDPAWSFLHGDDYERLAPHFAGALFDLRVDGADVWVTGDVASTAMWVPPGGERAQAEKSEQVWNAYRALAGEPAWARLMAYEDAVDAARPGTPYWYLGVLATRPDRQGEGRATTVMTPILDRADSQGTDCCLETSTEANKAFYERRGFTEATSVHIASGPPTWWLRRAPRAGS